MRKLVTLGGCSLVGLLLVSLATSPARAKKPEVEAEVAVLLKWYHTYFQEGKYQQAEQVAELAHDLAPDDPQSKAAMLVVRRQKTRTPPPVNVEQKLEKVLTKLEQIEKHLAELETEKQQLKKQVRVLKTQNRQLSVPLHQEPPGSPDRID